MSSLQKRTRARKRTPQSLTGDVFTVDEVAAKLRVARLTVYRALRAGDIPFIRVGRRYLIPKIAIERMLAEGQPIAA